MEQSFDIMIPRYIPIIRNFGWILLAWVIILFIVFWIFMYPSEGSTTEMRTAYFILAVPDSVKNGLLVAAIVLPVALIILRLTIYYKAGVLTVTDSYLELISKQWTHRFQYSEIISIQAAGGRHVFFFPNISMLFVIIEKQSKKHRFLLRHYLESEELMKLLAEKGLKLDSYEQ